MKLLSVCVGRPQEVSYLDRRGRKKTVATGIFKQPAAGRVMLRRLGLEGDGQADLVAHGGPDRAAYVYPVENYAYWADALGRADFDPAGQFGENFTVGGMTEDTVHIGDVFRIGEALVEVSQPRSPCFKLGIRMGVPDFHKQFAESLRVGFYLRVLEEGKVGAGDEIEPVRQGAPRLSVTATMRLLYFEPDNVADARRALEIPALSPGWRQSFAQRIAEAGG